MKEKMEKETKKPLKEGLMQKAKTLIDKADDLIDEKVEKVKKSKAYGSVAEAFDKAEDYVEDKIQDIKSGEFKDKIKNFSEKAEAKKDKTVAKAKSLGKKISAKAADKLDDIADNLRKKSAKEENQDPEA